MEIFFFSGSESILTVMERLVEANVNRLVIVDDDHKVVGIVTVSDLIHFLVLRPWSIRPSDRNKKASIASIQEEEEDSGESWKHIDPDSPPKWFHTS